MDRKYLGNQYLILL